LVKKNRASAHLVLFFLMTTQVVNAFFHIFFSLYYNDFSPGTITGIILYLPINILIISAAFKESFLKSYIELAMIGLFGIATFSLFELFGPIVIGLSIIVSFLYYTFFKNKLV
jgi:hypothetical protein